MWRDSYGLPDEASSIDAQAQAVSSVECHSPLMALHHGTPTVHGRQPTTTCKGQMYRDFGSSDWFFEIDETNGAPLWLRLGTVVRDPAGAGAIMANAAIRQRRMGQAVRAACRAG